MKDLNKYTYMFPMHTKLRINIGETGAFTKVLMDLDLEEVFLRKIVGSYAAAPPPEEGGYDAANVENFVKRSFAVVVNEPANLPDVFNEELYGEQTTEYISYTTKADYNMIPVDTWLNDLTALSAGPLSNDYGRYFVDDLQNAKNEEVDGMFDPDANPFLGQLALLLAKARISTLIKEKQRSYLDLLAGKLAYAETIMYRVAKHRVDATGASGPAIKSYYFFNSPDSNIVEFIDTQVRYGGSYRYVVYAYKAVIGTKYYYTAPTFKEPPAKENSKYTAQFDVVTSPSVVICEIPIYGTQNIETVESTTYIFDEAPIYPNVDIIPYMNLGNKMLINISENVGRYIDEPIQILEDDKERHDIMIRSQDVRMGNKIVFESEDPPSAYQIFRIDPDPETGNTKKPTSYEDFKDYLRYSIELTPNDSANASFHETVQINKKYYYTFRAIDVHDNISNPSPIYEVELVADGDKANVFPNIRVVNFGSKIKSTQRKELKRYIHIEPSLDQFVVGEDAHESALDVMPIIGLKEKRLFEADTEETKKKPNRFKIRMTSKKTGRKVDINVRFVHDHDFNVDRRKDLRNNSE